MSDRLPPIPDAELSPEQKRAAAELSTTARGSVFGPFVPLIRSPEMLNRLQRLGQYLRYDSALAPRLSEMARYLFPFLASRTSTKYVVRPALTMVENRAALVDMISSW